jgi:hypothetical protein
MHRPRARASAHLLLLVGLGGCARPTCPADDLECLADAFSVVDFEHFDDPSQREVLTVIQPDVLAAVPLAASAGLELEMVIGSLDFGQPDEGALIQLVWHDLLGCRPGFCFSHCPRGVRCFAPARCSPARNDGVTRAGTLHWVEYASTPARTTDMELSVTPVSAPGCPADVGALLRDGQAGPPVVLQVHLPGNDDPSPPDGPCGDGLQISTLNCTPIGSGGVADRCVSREEFESTTGLPLPAQCAPQGTSGCLDTQRGVLVQPCCPGLTCAVGSACGGGSTVGGVCL